MFLPQRATVKVNCINEMNKHNIRLLFLFDINHQTLHKQARTYALTYSNVFKVISCRLWHVLAL